MNGHYVRLVYVAVFLTLLTAGCERSEERDLQVVPPFIKVSVRNFTPFAGISKWTQTVTMQISRDADLRNLVDLRVFGELQPGVTAQQVETRFGKPSETRTDEFGTVWYSYKTELGQAEVGCEKATSPAQGGKEVVNPPCWWDLYAYTEQPVSNILKEPVLSRLRTAEQIRSKVSNRTLEFLDQAGQPILLVWLERERISKMRLLRHVE